MRGAFVSVESDVPLVLLSGLAADDRIFIPQKVAFPSLRCPVWLVPEPEESIDAYAKRLAATLDPGACVIGGASFGGIVALHLAKHVDARAVILIGSVKSPSQLPVYARCGRRLRSFIGLLPIRFLQLLSRPLTAKWLKQFAPFAYGLACQFRDSDPRVFKWSLARLLDWSSTPIPSCPVYHLHGDRDWTLPLRYTDPDQVVSGGGHVISLTHPKEVSGFIEMVLRKTSAEATVDDQDA